ncbi:unnamed protein product [Effrenium voratum]|uniref:Pentatricopeptide repeat-containing protein, chloroplastic n=1 Tax=Effrenium voratum TaxID=2562239 RepID=A0AA36IN35_9DINO|nr:unnamed protein product [Effrenium voratum]
MRGVPQVSCAQCEVTFNAAMSACEKMCAWRGGLQLFSELLCNNLQVDTIGFSVTISSLQRLGRWQPASKLLRDMPVWRIHRNTVGANAAIAACRGPDWPFTLDLLSWMPEAGMQPDRITMNSQISCSARGIQWISALHLFAHLGELGMRFNEVTLGAAAAALEDPGLWRMGAQLLTALTEGFRVEATTCFDASLRSCWKGGRPDLVLMLFDAMPRLRLPRDEVGFRTAVEASKEVASWRRSMGHLRLGAGWLQPLQLLAQMENEELCKDAQYLEAIAVVLIEHTEPVPQIQTFPAKLKRAVHPVRLFNAAPSSVGSPAKVMLMNRYGRLSMQWLGVDAIAWVPDMCPGHASTAEFGAGGASSARVTGAGAEAGVIGAADATPVGGHSQEHMLNAVLSLLSRDITPEDYELLLRLDEAIPKKPATAEETHEALFAQTPEDLARMAMASPMSYGMATFQGAHGPAGQLDGVWLNADCPWEEYTVSGQRVCRTNSLGTREFSIQWDPARLAWQWGRYGRLSMQWLGVDSIAWVPTMQCKLGAQLPASGPVPVRCTWFCTSARRQGGWVCFCSSFRFPLSFATRPAVFVFFNLRSELAISIFDQRIREPLECSDLLYMMSTFAFIELLFDIEFLFCAQLFVHEH